MYLRMYVLPAKLGGEAMILAYTNYGGYSIILFGLIMVECMQGDQKYITFFGCKFRRIYLPFLYVIGAQIMTRN